MSQNIVNNIMSVANEAYLIITTTLHGPDILDNKYAHAEHTLLVDIINDYHNIY